MLVASILVPLFMLVYYRFAGIVADMALVLNMLVLLALMMVFKAKFTLTGLAGLALTVGMAVDNNVLVFERLREEMERGATLRMAIRNAFHRAGATIIDCNLTHLLAARALHHRLRANPRLRNHAVPGLRDQHLHVGVCRPGGLRIGERRQWITKLSMLHLIKHTKIDFMRLFPPCAAYSVLVTVLGLDISGIRGQGLFDIDFTGGVSVQAMYRQPQDVNHIRRTLATAMPDVTITNMDFQGETKNTRFEINTSEQEIQKVQQQLKGLFGDQLVTNTLTFSPPAIAAGRGEAHRRKARRGKAAGQARRGKIAGQARPGEKRPSQAGPGDHANPAHVRIRPEPSGRGQPGAQALDSTGVGPSTTSFELTNDDYQEGSAQGYKTWNLKIQLPPDKTQKLVAAVAQHVGAQPYFPAVTKIGGQVAAGTRVQAIYALVASWCLIILYLWIRFQRVAFGLAAVIALIHDVLVMLGGVAASYYLGRSWASPWWNRSR